MAEAQSAPSIGELVAANYQILGTAGSGGMGVVYRARDLKLERNVALKFLPPDLNSSEREKERFLREARTASSLDHPNIGVIHGIDETADGRSFIVMAYYEGSSVAQRIRATPLSVAEALDVAIQMLRGLDHAHSHGIEHRDIKPSNIMLTQAGVAKIVDFGLAHFTQQTASMTHGISGTVAYMSPEQTMGKRFDQKADIWAAGVVLVEMLTGSNPFHRETIPNTVFAILNEAPNALDGLPPEVQQVVYRALSKDPARRYQSASEMLHDLEAARAALPEEAATATPSTTTRRYKEPASLRRTREFASVSAWQPPPARVNWRAWIFGISGLVLLIAALLLVPPIRQRIFAAVSGSGAATGPGSTKPAAYEGYLAALGYMQRYDKPGNIDRAITALQGSLKGDPLFALAYAELGEAYRMKYQTGRDPKYLDLALAKCQQAERLDNRIPAVYSTLAQIHNDQGKHDLALQEFQQALDINPRDPAALRGVARSAETAGKVDDAEASYRKSVAVMPDDWYGYNDLGNFYDRHGKYEQAVAQYKQAATLTPDNAEVFSNLGSTYLDWGDPKLLPEAEKALQKSVSLHETYPALANLAALYQSEGNYKQSIIASSRALALNAQDPTVWDDLRLAYQALGDQAQAGATLNKELTLLEAETKVDSANGMMQAMLGNLYAKKSLSDEALSRIQAAVAHAPDDPQVLLEIADAYENLHDHAQATSYIQKALKKGATLDSVKSDTELRNLPLGPALIAAAGNRR